MTLDNWKPDGFEIVREIGRGGMGVVYEAVDSALGRRVAIKTFISALAQQPTFLQRFEREARAAASITHPGVVTIHSLGQQDGAQYIVMEYVEGSSLAQLIDEKGPFELELASDLAIQACEGLAAAHAQGLIHRDIKPHNIMVTEDGRVKIADFGLVALAEGASELSVSGAQMGTPHYMAPETCEGKRPTFQTDIYSLGVVLYEILAGQHAINGSNFADFVRIITSEPFPNILEVRPDLPDALAEVIDTATDRIPENRFASCEDMAQAIRAAGLSAEPKAEALESFSDSGLDDDARLEGTVVNVYQCDALIFFDERDNAEAKRLLGILEDAGYRAMLLAANESELSPDDAKLVHRSRCVVPLFSQAFLETQAKANFQVVTEKAECLKPVYLEPCEADEVIDRRRGFRLFTRTEENAATDLLDAIESALEGDEGLDIDGAAPPAEIEPAPSATPARLVNRIDNISHRFRGGVEAMPGVLDRLDSALADDGTNAYLYVPSSTETCSARRAVIDYVDRNKMQFDVVWWIDSGSPVKRLIQFAALGESLHLPDAGAADVKQRIESVRHWLGSARHWLLVFANVGTPEEIVPYVPPQHRGRVIAITASKERTLPGDTIHFSALNLQQTDSVLSSAQTRRGSDGGGQLGQLLEGRVLATHLATRYLVQTDMEAEAYADELERRADVLGEAESLSSGPMARLAAQLSLTLEKLAEDVPHAVDFLKICSFLDCADIATGVLDAFGSASDHSFSESMAKENRAAIMEALTAYGLIELNANSISIDGAIQRLLRAWVAREIDLTAKKGRKRRSGKTRALQIEEADRDGLGHQLMHYASESVDTLIGQANAWSATAPYLPHLHTLLDRAEAMDFDWELRAKLWGQVARLYIAHKLYKLASAAFQNAIRFHEEQGRPDPEPLTKLHLGLARVYRERNDRARLSATLQRALAYWKDLPESEKGYDYLVTLAGAGEESLQNKDEATAKLHMETASEIAERLYADSSDVAYAKLFERLGTLAQQLGDPPATARLLETSLRIYKSIPGQPAPAERHIMRVLAHIYPELGDVPASIRYARELAGPNGDNARRVSSQSARDRAFLASSLWKSGEQEEAIEQMTQAVADAAEVHGPQSREVGLHAYNLATFLQTVNRLRDAEAFYKDAIAIFRNTIGESHQYTKTATESLQQVRASMERRRARSKERKKKQKEGG